MKYVYIPTEIKIRDFRSRLLIALKCADYGMTVIFGINNYIKKIIPNSPPGIYLDKSVSINKLSFLKTLKKKKNKIFCLDEESTTFFDNFEIYKNQRLNNKNIKILDKFFCLGKKEYSYNKNFFKKYKKKFFLTGNPRFEIDKNANKIFLEEINNIKKKFKNYFLVSRSFRYPYKKNGFNDLIDRAKKLGIINDKNDLKNYTKTRELRKELSHNQDRLVKYLAKRYLNKKFIVRPHPTEDVKKIKDTFKDYKNVIVVLKYEFAPWIVGAKNFIHSGCSTAYTALLNDVIPISFLKKEILKHYGYMPYNLISRVQIDEKLIEKEIKKGKLTKNLSKKKEILSKYIEIYKNFLPHEKIANEIFKSSFNSKNSIINKNQIFENYYSLKKILTKYFPKDNKGKYIFKRELMNNIKIFRKIFKINGNYKISCVENSVYKIKLK